MIVFLCVCVCVTLCFCVFLCVSVCMCLAGARYWPIRNAAEGQADTLRLLTRMNNTILRLPVRASAVWGTGDVRLNLPPEEEGSGDPKTRYGHQHRVLSIGSVDVGSICQIGALRRLMMERCCVESCVSAVPREPSCRAMREIEEEELDCGASRRAFQCLLLICLCRLLCPSFSSMHAISLHSDLVHMPASML